MSDVNVLGLVFASALLLASVVFLYLVFAPKSALIEAVMEAPATIQSLGAVLLPNTRQVYVLDATVMGYEIRVPCQTGWYWFEGVPRKGTLFYAPVPLGFVAKLSGVDDFSRQRFIDASSLCVVTELAGAEVGGSVRTADTAEEAIKGYTNISLLQRSRRWQVVLDGVGPRQLHVGAANNQGAEVPVRGYVAVNTKIGFGIDDAKMADIFSDQRNYIRSVEDFVVATLRGYASTGGYRALIANTSAIVAELNARWKNQLEQPSGSSLSKSCFLLETVFSAVVVKQYLELEQVRLQPFLTQRFTTQEQQLQDLQSDFENWKSNTQVIRTLFSNFKQRFDNLTDLKGHAATLASLRQQFTGLALVLGPQRATKDAPNIPGRLNASGFAADREQVCSSAAVLARSYEDLLSAEQELLGNR